MTATITRAPAYLTVQDLGRTQFREAGVPRSGAMDRDALATTNAVLGNDVNAAALEWALGGGTIRFDAPCAFSIGGAEAEASLGSARVAPFTVTHAEFGDTLTIGEFKRGRFLYIAFEGGIRSEQLLGSRSTYLPARFGGLGGKMIRSGQSLPLSASRTARAGFSPPAELCPHYTRTSIRVVPGPQWPLFSEEDRALFFSRTYSVSRASDRTGYRLDGRPLSAALGLLPSEPVCEGAVQVPPEGLPIVLMADSPTVGGYPKIGVVASTDLCVLAQLTPGERFQFEECSVQDAQRRARRAAASLHTIRSLAGR